MTAEQQPIPPQPVHAPVPVAPRKPLGRQTWQIVVTWVLLGLSVIGFAGTLVAPPMPLMFALGGPAANANRFGLTMLPATVLATAAWALVILFVATWVISVLLLVKKKVAFYVPLAAGVIASFIGVLEFVVPALH